MARVLVCLLLWSSTAFAADLPPAPVGPSAAERAEIDKLIRDLGHSDFAVRDGAFRKLGELEGKAYRPLLAAERASSDAEIRHRCGLLIPAARTADLNTRLAAFLADTKREFAHDLPGLARFTEATRDVPTAREFFAEMLRDPGTFKLLQVAESDPKAIPAAVLVRSIELQSRSGRVVNQAQPGLVIRPVPRPVAANNVDPSQAGIVELLGLFFADSLAPADAPPRRAGTGPTSLLYQQSIRTAVALPAEKNAATVVDPRVRIARAVLAGWFETREEAYELNVAISYAGQFEMPEVAIRAATKQLANKTAIAHMRGVAVATLAKYAQKDAIPTLEKLLTDTSQAGVRNEQEANDNGQIVNKAYPILTKDIALAMLLHLRDLKVGDYGLKTFATTDSLKFQYSNHWFRTEADRDAAFKKYAEVRAKEKK